MKKLPQRNPPIESHETLVVHEAEQPLVPDPSRPIPAVYLKSPTNYPLIYRKRVERVEGKARLGDLVAIYHQDLLLGYGLYNPRSEIVVRVVRRGQQLPDDLFWDELLGRAVELRRGLLHLDKVTDAYRLI